MARPLRIQYPDAVYHITCRGNERKEGTREGMLDCTLVLADFGGDTVKGRNAYRKQLMADMDEVLDVKEGVFGQSILGGEEFIHWVNETLLGESKAREQPSVGEIKRYQQKEPILALIEKETGKNLDALKNERAIRGGWRWIFCTGMVV